MPIIIAVSLGEPAGIGPDIAIMAAQQPRALPWLVFGSATVLQQRAQQLGLALVIEAYQPDQSPRCEAGYLTVSDYPCPALVQVGCLNAANSSAVLAALTAAAVFCQQTPATVLVTLPIHKGIINAAGIAFTGHTEWLAALSGQEKVVMMLGNAQLKVALQTVHVPLHKVATLITPVELASTLAIIQQHWLTFYHCKPHILVLGLNPHAGEDGYLGSEENAIIKPLLARLTANAYHLTGPVAADTAFTARSLQDIDVVLAMYHDQGLAPLKALAFGEIVNYTLGLPYIRTSVDHGVALTVAGSGQASTSSFLAAVASAETLAASRAPVVTDKMLQCN